MITFETVIERFGQMGDKTGWNYVFIPSEVTAQLKPGFKRSFRIQGFLDQVQINGMSLLPHGEGNYILALKAPLRKALKKAAGDKLTLRIEEDVTFKIDIPEDLELCLTDEEHMIGNFLKMSKSHQNYYINWINEAKTEATRDRRIGLTVKAMDLGLNFSEMMRAEKAKG